MVHGTWHPAGTGTATSGQTGPLPAILKLGAGEREVNWTTHLSQHAPDVIPTLYAAGLTLGGEPIPWLLMERCPHPLDSAWRRTPWFHRPITTLLDAGVRFHRAARQIAPPVGPQDVWVNWFSDLVHRALASDPPPPGPVARVIERLPRDFEWVLSVSRVEFAHGDLHLANAVWRTTPDDTHARALLIDHACHPLPWAIESAYCRAVYWGNWTEHPDYPTTTHLMAALRTSYGLEVPSTADVDRLAALCVAWQALRLWPGTKHFHNTPVYVDTVTHWVEAAASC